MVVNTSRPVTSSIDGVTEYWQDLCALYGTSSIAGYWPLWEASGATVQNIAPTGSGTYKNSPTLGTAGIGDGNTSVRLNNGVSNQCVPLHTAALATAFNPLEGSILIWGKVEAAAWTDATNRCLFHLGANDNNYVRILKSSTNNQLQATYRAGGTIKTASYTGVNTANWFRVGITWDKAGDVARGYFNGAQFGGTLTGLGVWAGSLAANMCAVGAQYTTPILPWAGWAAHAVLLNRALTPAEMEQDYLLSPSFMGGTSASTIYRSLPAAGYKGNTHAHSTASDGTGTAVQMVTAYKNAGFNFATITDHDWYIAEPTADPGVAGILFVPGMEETAQSGFAAGDHHIVALNPSGVVASTAAQAIIDANPQWAHLAHPLHVDFGGATKAEIEALTGLRAIGIGEVGIDTLWDGLLTDGFDLWGIADDDAHAVGEVAGRGWVVAYSDGLTVDAILTALRAGRFYSSAGPVLTITETGRKLKIETTTNCNFTFYGPNTAQLATVISNTKVAEYAYRGDEGYVRCYITEVGTGKRAWTNPVRIV